MRNGINAENGQLIYGWDHCLQSIRKCLTTRFASRVLRRHLGCDVLSFQDQNAAPDVIMTLYMAIVEALDDPDGGEPGFSLQSIDLVQFGRDGKFGFLLTGIFYPRGHLGDWSVREAKDVTWSEMAEVW